jgi:hypothetical protein
VDRRQQAFDALWPDVMTTRRLYFVEGTDAAKTNMEAAIELAEAAREDLQAAIAAMFAEAGVDPDELGEAEADPIGDPFPAISRTSVIEGAPPAHAFVEDHLPEAIELIKRHAPPSWLEHEPADLFRLPTADDGEPISIVKGVRLESERPRGHRLRQTISLAQDYLANDVRYDHFAGALAVTQLAQLGAKAEALRMVAGWEKRIGALFAGSGADTDATMLELLVAAACAAKGRDMSFVEATSAKSPDLRCNDAFGMVVECKRSSALSDYEVGEEARMRELFGHLAVAAAARGQFGLFEVELTVEAGRLDLQEVASSCLRQHLVVRPERALDYPWGSVAFQRLPPEVDLQEPTKAYSPTMLDQVFGWDMERPEWDGLVCKIAAAPAAVLGRVRSPLALAWRVVAEEAIIKRSRAPVGLFSKALTQIPRGEFGLVYVAYTEGARPDIADNRTIALMDRIQDWEHDAGIRVPAAFLVRQYPLPTGHGNPDVIESTIKMLSEQGGGGDWIFHEYPAAIYTSRD